MERVDAVAVDRPSRESSMQKQNPLTYDHRGPVAAGLEWITASEPRPRKRTHSEEAVPRLHTQRCTRSARPSRSRRVGVWEGTAKAHTEIE